MSEQERERREAEDPDVEGHGGLKRENDSEAPDAEREEEEGPDVEGHGGLKR